MTPSSHWPAAGRTTAALCAAVVLLSVTAVSGRADAAPASPAFPTAVLSPALNDRTLSDRTQDIPTPEEIAAAKGNERATADQVARIERLLAEVNDARQSSFAASLKANNAYGEALVELQNRRAAADAAGKRAESASKEQTKARKDMGRLAAEMYRNGGIDPALSTLASGQGQLLEQAATLEAYTSNQARTFESAEAAAAAAESLTAAAEDARKAADNAARAAAERKAEAEAADAARRNAVAEASARRDAAVKQLATLRNTTVALEAARVDGLQKQREAARLAAEIAAADEAAKNEAAARPPAAEAPAAEAPARPAPSSPAPQPAPQPERPAQPTPQQPAPRPPAQPAPQPPAPTPQPPAPKPPAPQPPAPQPGGSNQTAISVALSKVGGPYVWGGTGPVGFDCSGLVQYAFAAAGKSLPRTATDQFLQAPLTMPVSQAQPGDLLVWGSGSYFYHVAIYLGNGKVVQALNPDSGITVTDISMMSGMQLHPYAARY
ncbi:glycoside hydrolase [Arthrobacter sp. SW1]|uniref:C40 family peptidase n=1 Tax=Arthrobacter sp. SW1 TaxID=1920889 RepID=UPI000877C02C|nr:C40 family peptidase [Arthrobacter sp. SW1]OFI38402.1 glycoside hydrolase [Arthrobacter sp. SW1]